MFQFPAAPVAGQLFTPIAGVSYRWNGTAWYLVNTQSLTKATADAIYSGKPLLNVNPHFLVDQIREGGVCSCAGGSNTAVDGWTLTAVGGGTLTAQRVTDPNNSSAKCMEVKASVADAAIAAGDLYILQTVVEGFDAAVLAAGTAGAKNLTIQFAFQTTVPGVYGVSVLSNGSGRSYIAAINVPDALEHDYAITVPMDTVAGTWLYDNGTGLSLIITLAAGANFIAATNVWSGANVFAPAAQVNFMGVLNNTARLKRCELFQGDGPQPYTPPNFESELAKCQRYYQKSWSTGVAATTPNSIAGLVFAPSGNGPAGIGNSELVGGARFKVEMRIIPTVNVYSFATSTQAMVSRADGLDLGANSGFPIWIGTSSFAVQNQSGAIIAPALGGYMFHFTANCRLS